MKLGYIYGGKVIGDISLGTDPYTGLASNLTLPGDLTVEGDFTFGDAVVDTLIVNGRIATGSIAGTELDIDDTYTYPQLSEIRATVSDWSGVGGTFTGRYERYMASVDSTGKILRGSEMYLANTDTFDIAYMLGTLVNIMGKGNSTITLIRGAEIKLEWLATDTVTDAVGLRIEFAGLKVPTNVVYGLEFEDESALVAMANKFYEIKMRKGMVVMSGDGAPGMTAPKGSLYLRTNGTGAADRAYINTDGAGTWTNLVTAA